MPSCATPWLALAAVAMLLAGNVSPAAAQRQECLNANLNDGQGTYAKPPWVEKRSGNICVATCSICEATSSPYKISFWGESGSKLAAAGKHHCNLKIGNYAATGVPGVTPHASWDNNYREFNTYALGSRREWVCGAVKCRCTGCLPGYVLADGKKSCTACPANHYRSASDKHTDSCKRHSDCGGATPYVKQHGTASSNTVCRAATVSCSANQFLTQDGTSCISAKCAGNPATYDAGYGGCSTYAVGHKSQNNAYCAQDTNKAGEVAENVCRECGACTTGAAFTCTKEHGIQYGSSDHFAKYKKTNSYAGCMKKCEQNDRCTYFVYSPQNGYGKEDCWLKDDTKYRGKKQNDKATSGKCTRTGTRKETTTTTTTTTTTPEYVHHPKGCVYGHNIKLYHDKTVQECKSICDKTAGCVAFEYGVAYGGSGGYKPATCQPQSSANKAACPGAYFNLDLYVKQ